MRSIYFVLITLLLLNISVSVCPANSARIKRIDGSKIDSEQLTREIEAIVAKAKITGLSAVVINNNRIVYQNFFGVKDTRTNAKPDGETVFYAASFTKPLFAFAFLKLVEKGIFDLDTPIQKYLKKPIGEYERFKDLADEKNFEKITARMLLSHSSGLPILRGFYGNKLTLIAVPQEHFYYSNEGINLLGLVVEEHTGQKLENIIDESVFTPLGMNRSGMVWRKEFEDNYAFGHDKNQNVIGAQKRTSARAAGSMVTTADDYARFVIALMKKSGLSKNLFKQMLKPQIEVESERGFGPGRDRFNGKFKDIGLSWGLGLGLFQTSRGKSFFHSGHTEGWQNYFVAYPDKKIAVILMSNSDNFEPVADQILDLTIRGNKEPLEWLSYFDKQN